MTKLLRVLGLCEKEPEAFLLDLGFEHFTGHGLGQNMVGVALF